MARTCIARITDLVLAASLAVLAVGAGGASSIALAAVHPPTLTGESLVGTATASGTCNPGGSSTITFQASGTATGPYAGTFMEYGRTTMSPTVSNEETSPLVSLDAVFLIQSANGYVAGRKTLMVQPEGRLNRGACFAYNPITTVRGVVAPTTYWAVIRPPGEDGRAPGDRGANAVNLFVRETNGVQVGEFSETFSSG